MRAFLISIVSAFLLSAPAHAAASGAYAAAQAASPEMCAQRCADDGLCMMWVYHASTTCELRAGVSQNLEALAVGVSPHAPQFVRAMSITTAPIAESAADPTPAPPPRRPRHDVVLLGAPDTDRSGLRSRIGGN
ncbi:MAG: hypothetical protein QM759_00580 [Terricaulis sp.]